MTSRRRGAENVAGEPLAFRTYLRHPDHPRRNPSMLLALAQTNPIIGDLEGNAALIRDRVDEARRAGAEVVLFPELAVSGYPPEDLLLRSDFVERCRAAVEEVAEEARDIVVAFGAPLHGASDLHNALVVAAGGQVRAVYHKRHLPNYGVFDEARYFGAGEGKVLVRLGGHVVGVTICSDIWIPDGPATAAARAGAELILNASASPYHAGKAREREAMLSQRARDMLCPIAYCNLWGGQDELVFDGGSMAVDHQGRVVARAAQFRDELLLCPLSLGPVRSARLRDPRLRAATPIGPDGPAAEDLTSLLPAVRAPSMNGGPPSELVEPLDWGTELWEALCTGIRDHARKNRIEHAVVGLGGGIDSSLVAVLACDALGPERVTGMVMPSADSSREAEENARELVRRLGCELREIPTDELRLAYEVALAPELDGTTGGFTRERVEARIRSNLLMALSNQFGWLLLSTGNKSELACGYSTLYGETFGGFAAIKDLPRTLVVLLAQWRQERDARPPIPEGIMTRPHGGVRPDQWALDGLPPFDQVDPIIQAYVEDDEDPNSICARGHDAETVRRVVDLIEAAEYKRRQMPPGIKISTRAFGRDRRMPIAHRFAG